MGDTNSSSESGGCTICGSTDPSEGLPVSGMTVYARNEDLCISVNAPTDKPATTPYMDPATHRPIPQTRRPKDDELEPLEQTGTSHSSSGSSVADSGTSRSPKLIPTHSLGLPILLERQESRLPDEDEIAADEELAKSLSDMKGAYGI